jgi:uncharacterized membrane protein YraQ (UPF0718 family)
MEILIVVLQSGWDALREYLSAHVLTCLVPAFFIAGAISVFISQGSVIKYFGPKANKLSSYSVASVSGAILAVCSCTVLPLFGGIYKRGAGIGPAVAFLYSGPAINVLAIVYTARILGFDIGFARAASAIIFAAGIGLIMALIYDRSDIDKDSTAFDSLPTDVEGRKLWQNMLFLSCLVGILIFAASSIWLATVLLLAILIVILRYWFTNDEITIWLKSTLHFARLIVPWLLLGVFVAGIITAFVPHGAINNWIGANTISANFIASFIGALMYFATLTEVPIVSAFVDLGMNKGPALALLLAGPALSLPNMLVIRSIMGTKKTFTYIALVVVFATFTGYVFGSIM